MDAFANQLEALVDDGYKLAEAQAKVAHDAILFAMHKSGTHASIRQDERRFGALSGEKAATLFANTREQIFAEKLLSLIKHGALSTRAKDVFDLYFLTAEVNQRYLRKILRWSC